MNPNRSIPVTKGKTYTIHIDRLGTSGEGVGKYEGFTVFVPYALPGEDVEATVILVKKTYATAALQVIKVASPDRVTPACPVYDRCGGCQLQHLSYEGQLKEKRQQVIDAFERIGHLKSVNVLPVLGAKNPWHYRNKMQFPVAKGKKKGSLAIGCFAQATHKVIDVAECHIQKKENNAIAAVVRQWMKDFKIPPYDEDAGTGIVRHVMGRVGAQTGEVMVCLVTTRDQIPHMKDLVKMLRAAIPGLVSVVQNVNTRHTNVILGNKTRLIYGKDTITDSIGPLTFHISAQSFFQVNSEQAARLYETALQYADLKGKETVADVYCGTGTITLFLAQKAKEAYGIEIVAPAIKDAYKNAKDNKIKNASFILGDAVYKLPELIRRGIHPDVIVLDPPRAGCGVPVLQAIAHSKPKRVVYVSCNPATLARDAAILVEKGYHLDKVQPCDMFPATFHIENVAVFTRK